MANKWQDHIRTSGELKVHNMAGKWSPSVNNAIRLFNGLGFGVKLVNTPQRTEANIVVKLSLQNADSYTHKVGRDEHVIKVNFDANGVHGKARTLVEQNRHGSEIFFAAVFLPGKRNTVNQLKELIIVHEFIHAAGMNEDHDPSGIMADMMSVIGNTFVEIKGAPPMPPIRVGGKTMCMMRDLWLGEACAT